MSKVHAAKAAFAIIAVVSSIVAVVDEDSPEVLP